MLYCRTDRKCAIDLSSVTKIVKSVRGKTTFYLELYEHGSNTPSSFLEFNSEEQMDKEFDNMIEFINNGLYKR